MAKYMIDEDSSLLQGNGDGSFTNPFNLVYDSYESGNALRTISGEGAHIAITPMQKISGITEIVDVKLMTPDGNVYDGVKTLNNWFNNMNDLVRAKVTIADGDLTMNLFAGCSNLVDAEVDFGKSGNIAWAFNYCGSLTSVSITANEATSATYLCNQCGSLKSINLSLPKAQNTSEHPCSMFSYCSAMTDAVISIPLVTDISYMCNGCCSLSSLTMDFSNVVSANNAFYMCKFSSINETYPRLQNAKSMFSNCTALTSFSAQMPSLTAADDMLNSTSQLDEIHIVTNNTMADKTAEYFGITPRRVYDDTTKEWVDLTTVKKTSKYDSDLHLYDVKFEQIPIQQ